MHEHGLFACFGLDTLSTHSIGILSTFRPCQVNMCANALIPKFGLEWPHMKKEEMTIAYISDVVNSSDLKLDAFNLIAAGCGTGKTYWVINNLVKELKGVEPCEIAFVTSRSITKEQQSRNLGTTKFSNTDPTVLNFWNGKRVSKTDDDQVMENYGVQLLTYDQIIRALKSNAVDGREVLQNLKVVIFDECHVLFSDNFIDGLDSLRLWIREVIYGKRKYIIGLSATIGIIEFNNGRWGVPLHSINRDLIAGYKAKQLICTNFDTIPYLISANKLPGKTIIMCRSIQKCKDLESRLSNATVLVSKGAKEYTPEMDRIRRHIIKYEELPSWFLDKDGERRDLEVLIATSTLREGFNLRESSGVRNVITCMTDELHIIQFAGRCRYNIDNLVIAETERFADRFDGDDYMVQSRNDFTSYMKNKECGAWFEPIMHIVDHDIYGIKKFILGTEDNRFIAYINSKWLVPKGADEKQRCKYRIWRDEDRDEIVQMSRSCRMFKEYDCRITFARVVRLLQNGLGYEVESGRAIFEGEKQTYKLVVSYDADAATYVPKFPTIAEGMSI